MFNDNDISEGEYLETLDWGEVPLLEGLAEEYSDYIYDLTYGVIEPNKSIYIKDKDLLKIAKTRININKFNDNYYITTKKIIDSICDNDNLCLNSRARRCLINFISLKNNNLKKDKELSKIIKYDNYIENVKLGKIKLDRNIVISSKDLIMIAKYRIGINLYNKNFYNSAIKIINDGKVFSYKQRNTLLGLIRLK